MAIDGGPITSASFPPVARLRTRRLILLGTLMEKEVPSAALLAKLYQALNRDQDQALFGLRPQSSAGTDRTPALAFAPLESWRPVRLPDGSWGRLYSGPNAEALPWCLSASPSPSGPEAVNPGPRPLPRSSSGPRTASWSAAVDSINERDQ